MIFPIPPSYKAAKSCRDGDSSQRLGLELRIESPFWAEADLGMFSMVGRTGAPTKKGPPQDDRQIFATWQHAGNN